MFSALGCSHFWKKNVHMTTCIYVKQTKAGSKIVAEIRELRLKNGHCRKISFSWSSCEGGFYS
jgi:hypothetical protein